MNLPDWVTQILVAVVSVLGTACVAVIGWIFALGARVSKSEFRITSMEAAMQRLEVHQSETAKAMVESLRELRTESRAVIQDIADAREKALETFVTKADIKDLLIRSKQ